MTEKLFGMSNLEYKCVKRENMWRACIVTNGKMANFAYYHLNL